VHAAPGESAVRHCQPLCAMFHPLERWHAPHSSLP
jgi:hypothetical protein